MIFLRTSSLSLVTNSDIHTTSRSVIPASLLCIPARRSPSQPQMSRRLLAGTVYVRPLGGVAVDVVNSSPYPLHKRCTLPSRQLPRGKCRTCTSAMHESPSRRCCRPGSSCYPQQTLHHQLHRPLRAQSVARARQMLTGYIYDQHGMKLLRPMYLEDAPDSV